MRQSFSLFFPVLMCVATLFTVISDLFATQPPETPTTEVWSDPRDNQAPIRMPIRPIPHRDLSNYVGQFELTCAFLY